METAINLALKEFGNSFNEQLKITDHIRKLASWSEEGTVSYIHLRDEFKKSIKAYEIKRRISRLKLIEYESTHGQDKKSLALLEILANADEEMNRFLSSIFELSKNKLFNYQLKDL